MNELFGGRFAPITDTIGFLRCNPDRAVEAFLSWQGDVQSQRGVELEASTAQVDLSEALPKLLPLTSVERRRFLFVPTRSDWTAFVDNGHEGTDAFSHISYLAEQIGCDGVRATWVPEERPGQWPATVLELYGPEKTDFLNTIRSIAVSFDGSKWFFSADGEVQSFEEVSRYKERSIKKRFDGSLLDTYLRHLGISMFDESFFTPTGARTTLVEKFGPIAPAAQEFGLKMR
ncbi:hypothetical protein [Sphingomonas mucosissima]|uniref:Uncharacterized protein n=1 Tax=Sphingomonas mucosissima TaxID=370959 RepID=A0A245ZMI1_9SPHN|nr:hypothetical protein [Sphingomonas mucosissima]OWK30949.1 hypothetical protein SPMU_19410 [Sphingomonas mucosissima]